MKDLNDWNVNDYKTSIVHKAIVGIDRTEICMADVMLEAIKTLDTPINDYKMRCCICKTPLIITGELRRLQTLVEHGLTPNKRPILKNTYICTNKNCPLSNGYAIWDFNGVLFFRDFMKNYIHQRLQQMYIDEHSGALNSTSRTVHLQSEAFKKIQEKMMVTKEKKWEV